MDSGESPLLQRFPWPVPPRAGKAPVWDGSVFHVDADHTKSVLVYTDNDSHWSDDLTLLHETEAGKGDHPIDIASRHLAVQTLKRHPIAGKGIILDVGCSSGFLLQDIRRILPGAALIGSDYIMEPLQRLAPRLPGVPLLQFDLRSSPLPDACADAIVSLNVLEHIDDDEKALHEIHRMLKPGGVAHLEVPSGPSCYDIYDEYLMHHRRYTMSELVRKSRAAGLTVESRTHLGAFAYPVFYTTKWLNRRFLNLSPEAKADKVRGMMRRTRSSAIVALAMRLELLAGRMLPYPFGIRCVVVLRK